MATQSSSDMRIGPALECLAVAAAGGLVWVTGTLWPDLFAGVVLAANFPQSA